LRLLFFIMLKQITYLKSVYKLKDLPENKLPEIILCGRSNVGKSSFINSLFNRKSLAKTSSTPGKTRALNYYLIEDKFYLVDLPGFGYAKVSKEERDYWNKLLQDYFSSGRNIISAFHIIDSRHKPTPLDLQLNAFLKKNNLSSIFLLNKVDKLNRSEIIQSRKLLVEAFPEASTGDNVIFYSSVDHTGRKEVIKKLLSLL